MVFNQLVYDCVLVSCNLDANLGYIGDDCGLVKGSAPSITELIPGALCDVQNKPCQKIRILANNFGATNNMACRVKYFKVKTQFLALMK